MSKGNVTIKYNRLPNVAPEVVRQAADLIEATAVNIQAKAKTRSRVDTGALKASWTSAKDPSSPLAWVVGSDQEHSIYNEFGTRYMSPKPMLVPSFNEEVPRLRAALQQLARGLGK